VGQIDRRFRLKFVRVVGCKIETLMKIASGVLAVAALVVASGITAPSALACNDKGNCANAPGHVRGAPGPIVGASLPIVAIGYGVYWLVKRRRHKRAE
jgi:hypothetical protein